MKAGTEVGRLPGGGLHRILVVALAIVSAASFGATVWLTILIGGPSDQSVAEVVALELAFYAYLVAGLLLVAKTPRNPLGWALTGVGLLASLGPLATSYAEYSFGTIGRRLPGATFAAWFNSWWWFPTIALVFLFVPLLFPDGTPLTPRWRWLHRLSVVVLATMVFGGLFNPVLKGDTYSIPNPIGVPAIGDIEKSTLGTVVFIALLACTLLALLSLILRFRRSSGIERQQMKWFLFGAAAIITLVVVEEVLAALELDHLVPDSNILFAIVVALLPVTIGIAVLKYRLYEIDRIISRTLSYGLLTAVLLALYLGAVTGLTAATAPFMRQSTRAVAAATLLAAAAFGPARRRIQSIVDRRFNRARYDAARTVDEFRGRLRDELDLSAITTNVRTAIEQTVQPSQVVVWLRPEAGS